MNIRERLQTENPDTPCELLFLTQAVYDEAIIDVVTHRDNYTNRMVKAVRYDKAKVIEANMKEGMDEEEAVDFFYYNQAGGYVGEQTPVFV